MGGGVQERRWWYHSRAELRFTRARRMIISISHREGGRTCSSYRDLLEGRGGQTGSSVAPCWWPVLARRRWLLAGHTVATTTWTLRLGLGRCCSMYSIEYLLGGGPVCSNIPLHVYSVRVYSALAYTTYTYTYYIIHRTQNHDHILDIDRKKKLLFNDGNLINTIETKQLFCGFYYTISLWYLISIVIPILYCGIDQTTLLI